MNHERKIQARKQFVKDYGQKAMEKADKESRQKRDEMNYLNDFYYRHN